MYWREIECILDLAYRRDDYENSEFRKEYGFLGGAVMQYAWVTQKCARTLDEKHIVKIFEKMIRDVYQKTERGHVEIDEILNYCKYNKEEFKILEGIQYDIRHARTFEDFEIVIKDFSSRIQKDLKVNSRVGDLLSFGLITFEGYCHLCNDEVIEGLAKHFEYFSEIKQYDYIADGMPAIKNLEHRDTVLSKLSRKKRQHILELEKLAKECFYDNVDFRNKINVKDRQLLKEYSYLSLSLVASTFKKGDFKELSKLTIEAAEKETIEKLERVAPLYDLVDEAMYKCTLEILNEDIPQKFIKKPEALMRMTSRRVLECTKNELDQITDILYEILNINVNLGKQLSHLTLLSNSHNSEKYAKILRSHGVDMAKYWVTSVIDEVADRLEFYTEFINNLLTDKLRTLVGNENLVIEKPTEDKIRKSLGHIGKFRELNKIAGNKGFQKVRQKGDHGVFRRYDGSTVIIPQGREIRKGLSLRIQKDLNREETFKYE